MAKKPSKEQEARLFQERRAQRENLEKILSVHIEFVDKIPTLDYAPEVRDQLARGGERYTSELREEIRALM